MKRISLFCALLSISSISHAFTLTEQHCDLLQEGTETMVQQNREGMSLEAVKFDVENHYRDGPNKQAYEDIKPFIYAVTEEYYSNNALAEIDYASVIGRNCRENIGNSTKK